MTSSKRITERESGWSIGRKIRLSYVEKLLHSFLLYTQWGRHIAI